MRFFDFAEYLNEEDFTLAYNKAIFLSIRSLMFDKKSDTLSKSKIIAEAKSIGYDNFMSMTKNGELLDELISEKTNENDIGNAFLEVKRQSLRRAYSEGADNIQDYLSSTSDPLDKIIANVEDMIVSKTVVLDYGRHAIKNMTKGLKDFVSDLAKNTGHLGLDIGFPIWQSRCGQIRNGSITFIAATAKCLAGDTRIYDSITGKYYKINHLPPVKVASMQDTGQLIPKQITNHLYQGKKSIHLIKTRLGHEIKCTKDHLLLTDNFIWKENRDIKLGDRIAVSRKLPEPSNPYNILTKDQCYILGLLFGDADCTGNSTVIFTNQDKSIIDKLKNICSNLNIDINQLSELINYGISSDVRTLLEIGGFNGCKAIEKSIGDNIYSLSNDRLASFLAGLWDTDGSILNKTNSSFLEISITLATFVGIKQIQELLLRFGIVSRIAYKKSSYKNNNGEKICKNAWRLHLISKDSIIAFKNYIMPSMGCSHKMETLKLFDLTRKDKSNYDTFDSDFIFNILRLHLIEKNISATSFGIHYNKRYTSKRISRNRVRKIGEVTDCKKLIDIANSDIIFDEVIEKKSINSQKCYDLSILDSPNFVANNIVVHNCGKSQFGLRAALTVAHKLNLPVLLVDSELSEADQKIRLVGMLAKVPYNIIETGYWKLTRDELKIRNINDEDIDRILDYSKRLRDDRLWEIAEKLPIDYMQISGMSVQEVIPHMRRWLLTKVKPNKDSKFPECLIVYDYIKLANVDELHGGKIAEYQVHGLNVAGLHDFCKDYNIPILTFGQTNREIDDNFNCVAGSKRIVENVDSISLIKKKTEEEKSMDPTGSHLMRVWAGRHGSGTDSSHINVEANLEYGEFTELNLSTVNFAEVKAKKLEDWKKKRKGKSKDDEEDEED